MLRVNKNLATGVSHGFFFASKIALADLWFRESSWSLMDSTFNWAFPETELFLWRTVASAAVASLHTFQNIKFSSNTNHGLPCFQLVWNDRCLWLFSYSWLLSRASSLLWIFSGAAVHIQRGTSAFCIPNSRSLPTFVFLNVPHRPLGKSGVTCQ